MKPSSLRSRTISSFILEAGTSTRSLRRAFAFRILVKRSAIGSINLPGGLDDARDLALMGRFSEANPAKAEVAVIGARAAAKLAAVAIARRELLRLPHFCYPGRRRHSPLS